MNVVTKQQNVIKRWLHFMEFNRGGRQQPPQSAQNNSASSHSSGGSTPPPAGSANNFSSEKSAKKKGTKEGVLSLKNASVALLFSATILVAALILFLLFATPRSEANFIEDDKYQAVFLNGGQVYFGQVTHLNSEYLRLVDIYYLRVNQQVQPAEGEDAPIAPADGDISLVKLGCELHGPKDEMLINRDQIIFWENLKPEGQVSEAIAEFKRENPDGQDCETPDQPGGQQQPVGPDVDPLDFDAALPEEVEAEE